MRFILGQQPAFADRLQHNPVPKAKTTFGALNGTACTADRLAIRAQLILGTVTLTILGQPPPPPGCAKLKHSVPISSTVYGRYLSSVPRTQAHFKNSSTPFFSIPINTTVLLCLRLSKKAVNYI